MRRGMVIVPVLLAILLMVGIGAAAYNAGENQGQQNATEQIQSAQANGQAVQVVHVVDDNHGFFPGFFLFPFFLIGMSLLIGGIFRAARWGGKGHHGHGPGPWNDEGRQRFEDRAREWHQREHGGGDTPPAPTTAA